MVTVIQADPSYAQILSDLGRRLFYETFVSSYIPSNLQLYLDSNYTLELQTKELNDPTFTTFIAFGDDNEALGFCQLRQREKVYDFIDDPQAIELKRIYIDQSCIGKGIGKLLINTSIEKAKEFNKKTMWLGVWENNLHAIKFYEYLGFTKVGSQVFELGTQYDTDYIYVKAL